MDSLSELCDWDVQPNLLPILDLLCLWLLVRHYLHACVVFLELKYI